MAKGEGRRSQNSDSLGRRASGGSGGDLRRHGGPGGGTGLPLSDNMDLNKNLGTRHRAGVGISEVTDSFTIIVSEETGNVSYASGGELHTAVTPSDLRDQLHKIQKLAKKPEEKKGWHIGGMRQKVEGEKK